MVYKAVCKVNDVLVALKKVQIFEMVDAKARLDCMKEIQLLQVLYYTKYGLYGIGQMGYKGRLHVVLSRRSGPS